MRVTVVPALDLLMTRLWKSSSVHEPAVAQSESIVILPDESNVTVPVPDVNVPSLVQDPPTVIPTVEEPVSVALAFISTEPLTSITGSLVSVPTVTVLLPLPIVKLLPIEMVCEAADPSVKDVPLISGAIVRL